MRFFSSAASEPPGARAERVLALRWPPVLLADWGDAARAELRLARRRVRVQGLKGFGEPARKALIIGHCPAALRGRMVGAYYLIRDPIVTAGTFFGAALWKFGPAAKFWTASALRAACTVFTSSFTNQGPPTHEMDHS